MISLLLGLLPAASGISVLVALIGLFSPDTVAPWARPRRLTVLLFYLALAIGFGALSSEAHELHDISNSWLAMGGALAGLSFPYWIMSGGGLIRRLFAGSAGKREQKRTLSLDDDDDFDVIRAEWRAAARARRENDARAEEQPEDESILTVEPDVHGPVLMQLSVAARRLSGEGLHAEFQQAEKLFRVYRRFQVILSDQFRPGEITADRFAGYAEQTIIGATANFEDMLRQDGALKSLRETGGSAPEKQRLVDDLQTTIKSQYGENQNIISSLGVATAELARLDMAGEDAGQRTDFALMELQRLSTRTAEFVAREKNRA